MNDDHDDADEAPLDLGWTLHLLRAVQAAMYYYGPTNRLLRLEEYLILRSQRGK